MNIKGSFLQCPTFIEQEDMVAKGYTPEILRVA
jgi:hypothetical protein